MMTDVLTKLLAVVVADPLAEIRLATLREFNTDFHKQLALSENIQVSVVLGYVEHVGYLCIVQ